jgi:hypothetical protein
MTSSARISVVVIPFAPLNAAATIRRSVWKDVPYDETFSTVEDKFWAFEVLKRGHRICNSTATFLYLKDRTFTNA